MILEMSPVEVSIVIPAHNEADNLPLLVSEIRGTEWQLGRRFEIVVVDDCSTDGTQEALAELAENNSRLVVARMRRQSGQSAALAAGFDLAKGRIIVTMDADLQNDPADIGKLLDVLEVHDVAIGWRRDRKDPWSKKIISKIANAARNWITGECVKDTGCGIKAFRAECLRQIPRFDGMHRFFPTLVKMQGYSVGEAPVRHRPRTKGVSHYNIFNRFLRPMVDVLAVRWLQKRTLRYQVEKEPANVFQQNVA